MKRVYSRTCDRCKKRSGNKEDIFPPHWSWWVHTSHDERGKVEYTDMYMLCDECTGQIQDLIGLD